MRPPVLNPLFAPLSALPGVGPKLEKVFARLLGRGEGEPPLAGDRGGGVDVGVDAGMYVGVVGGGAHRSAITGPATCWARSMTHAFSLE